MLFPNVFLPLHIFEPRYREMVGDALDGDRIIGMVLLRPGWEGDYEGRPPVYPVGCAGLITHAERLADGRYNIVLRGLEKFRIAVARTTAAATASRSVEPLMEEPSETRPGDRCAPSGARLEALLVPQPEGRGVDPKVPPSMPDEDLSTRSRSTSSSSRSRSRRCSSATGLLARCRSLIELLEMKVIVAAADLERGSH